MSHLSAAEVDAIALRVERFVRETIAPYEHDPRCGAHGPSEELVLEMRALARARASGGVAAMRRCPQVRGVARAWLMACSTDAWKPSSPHTACGAGSAAAPPTASGRARANRTGRRRSDMGAL